MNSVGGRLEVSEGAPPFGEGLPDLWTGLEEGTFWEGGLVCGSGSGLLDLSREGVSPSHSGEGSGKNVLTLTLH